MCGIFGSLYKNSEKVSANEIISSIDDLIRLSAKRGRDAIGLLLVDSQGHGSILKKALDPIEFLRQKRHHELIRNCHASNQGNLLILGQCRLSTAGSAIFEQNNQPHQVGKLIGVFNGLVTYIDGHKTSENFNRLEDKKRIHNDAINFFDYLSQEYQGADANFFKAVEGSANFIAVNLDEKKLIYGSNNGSLYVGENENHMIITSEKNFNPLKTSVVAGEVREYDLAISKNFELEVIKSTPFRKIKRCLKCILPATHPFIEFDDKGVCNYCRDYRNQKYLGKEKLSQFLDKYRKNNQEYDCIVGLSGGRDSCYALHYLKKEMGMNPIAYTYDWGLTTEKSRRNQSIMCEKLGVEHIIRSANLEKKRRYIRKNVTAWMKKPHLGMVPLFQAGDKDFFEYGRTLRKEFNIDLTVMGSGHQMEQREFMVGFTGLRQPTLHNNPDFYHHPLSVKVNLASRYILEYLKNPAYLNESFFDSIRAYIISFFSKTSDFLYLFRYIPWDESEIERVLREQYGWEADEKYGKNQWRMGDGQTAFNNFIYYHVAGLTEYDSFRSHQIREGLLTREEALNLVEAENQPKFESISEFFETVGLPFEEVIKRILAIDPIY